MDWYEDPTTFRSILMNLYFGTSNAFNRVGTLLHTLSHIPRDPPLSRLWSIEEQQLLQDVAKYWVVMEVKDTMEKIVDWDSVAEQMNEDSKKYLISDREYNRDECCDMFMRCSIDFTRVNCIWSLQEHDLVEEAIQIYLVEWDLRSQLPRLRNCASGDYEEIKLFMNREAYKRRIRQRYFSMAIIKAACRARLHLPDKAESE